MNKPRRETEKNLPDGFRKTHEKIADTAGMDPLKPGGELMRSAYQKCAGAGVLMLIVFLLTGAAYRRNSKWHEELSIWQDTATKSPRKSRVRNNLAKSYALLKRYFPAIEEFYKAIELDKNNMEAYNNLAIALEDVGMINDAIENYRIFCKHAPYKYIGEKYFACRRAAALTQSLKNAGTN